MTSRILNRVFLAKTHSAYRAGKDEGMMFKPSTFGFRKTQPSLQQFKPSGAVPSSELSNLIQETLSGFPRHDIPVLKEAKDFEDAKAYPLSQ